MSIRWQLLGLILLIPLFFGCVQGPQPQAPRVKKTCLDCHPDYKDLVTKDGPIVHQPVSTGQCNGCHRPHGLVGGAFLKSDPPQLCLRCHRSVWEELGRKNIHKPARRACFRCHQPHSAPEKGLLKKPVDSQCLECHGEIDQREVKHQALEEGCLRCHETHASDQPALLKEDSSNLCLSCHTDEKALEKAHFGYEVKKACIDCHDPHGAQDQKLLRPSIHQPVIAGKCNSCHLGQGERPLMLKGDPQKSCLECHRQESGPSTHPPYVQGKCLTCHGPHGSAYFPLLSESPKVLCT
ncbi:cytochrome c3 family protein, partial [Thermosulfuriphilus sp.]